ncbi:MAG TPA: carboxypeptidase-like regulatory domain-containing protein [Nevskiaceae bacterium]|nr:carboxypeptidase-like regulatory domain-containing protein [Nevskiaceae bacterium]
MTRSRLLACALGAAIASGAVSQDSALPPVDTQGAIRYLSGGIGADESAAIKAAQSTFPLSITFSSRSGGRDVFLADVPVRIRNASGETILDVTTEGPYLLVDLPAGNYRVSATWQGIEKSSGATIVSGRNQKLAFLWPGTEPEAPAPSPEERAAAAAASAAAMQAALPAINTQGGIPYLSGGVGAAESAAIKIAASRYSLSVTFTRVEGTRNVYLATIPVKVVDKSGSTVLDLVTDGPFLLADLPPGEYRVVASYQGVEKQATARVAAGKPAKVTLVWPTAP